MSDKPRAAYLGLRSNAHFFASHQGFLKLDARLKALALVYDHLIFEDGIYQCTVGERGRSSWVTPYDDPEQLKPIRTRRGARYTVRAGLTGSTSLEPVIDTTVVQQYRAQFISTVDELRPLKPEWVSLVSLDLEGPEAKRPTDKTASDWMWRDQYLRRDINPHLPSYLRDVLFGSIYTDLARSNHYKADLAPDPIHSKLLRRLSSEAALHSDMSGARTLSLYFPDIRHASWEDINDLRKDRGLASLRAKLREIEASGGADQDVLRRIAAEYAEYMENHRPTWKWVAASLGWTLLSCVPLFNVPAAVKPIDTVRKARQAQNHWTATLMRIQRRVTSGSKRGAKSA